MEELFQTNKGLKPKFMPGDRVGKLVVDSFIGKRLFPQKQTYEPVYKCKCDCGNECTRRQRYLQYKLSSTKCCQECGKKALRRSGSKGGKQKGKGPLPKVEQPQDEGREEKINRIMAEIFEFKFKPCFEQENLVSTERDLNQGEIYG